MLRWTLNEWLRKFWADGDIKNSASLTDISARSASTMNLSGKEQFLEETSADFQRRTNDERRDDLSELLLPIS